MESMGSSVGMESIGNSGMYIVDPEYEKKRNHKCSRRWCLLLIVLVLIAVIAGGTVGILKAIQSSGSSETRKEEGGACSITKCTRTPATTTTATVFTQGSSSIESILPSKASYPVPTSSNVVLVETLWSSWQAWSKCSTSCGGGIQTRKRVCGNSQLPNVIADCYGSNVLQRNCSNWKCPDCAKSCPTGYLNEACDACICTNVTIRGTVKNQDGILLRNATVALSEFPFNILATTNVAGHFELKGICVSQEDFLVERNGYLPQTLNTNKIDTISFTISASLEAIVFPEVTVQPESKVRIEGQGITLCCAGVGKPEPKYEWIMNGRSVSEYQQDEGDSSKLIIPRLHRNMTGEVKCRVYNDYGAEFSTAAQITVISKNDSCNDKPFQDMMTLPPGCVDEGTNSSTVDVGRCGDERCISSSIASLHKCSDNYCCRSVTVKNVLIRCATGFFFNITRKTKCGCGPCLPKTTTVKGIASGGPNSIPFKFGYIHHAGKYLTRTGRNGDFSFTISGDATRIVLNFKGKDRYNDFQDLTKVVSVVPGRQTFVEVKMKLRPKPVLVNASETIEIPMGHSNSSDGQSNTAPVVLSLPPHSLMTESGEIYNGTANLEVSFDDPRNASQVQEADGDFTAISEEGDEQLLETFGVLKIDFTDSNGKPLQANTDINVMLDLDEYNITEKEAEAIKLWYMDEKTGRWRIMDSGLKQHESRRSKRSGRKFYFGKIDNTRLNYLNNLDAFQGAVCFVKFTVENQNNDPGSVTITIASNQGGLNRYREYSVSTGTSTCVRTLCKSLTIQAKIGQDVLKPKDRNINPSLKNYHGITYYRTDNLIDRFSNRITIRDISNLITTDGPFFKSKSSCDNSPADSKSLIFDTPVQPAREISPDDSIKWHDNEEFRVCYVKIAVKNSCSDQNVTFHVKSSNVDGQPKEEGFTIVSISSSSLSTCAEFKCPPTKTRSIRVTITPFVNGMFKMKPAFKSDHIVQYAHVFEGSVASFKPVPGLTKFAIGVIDTPRRNFPVDKVFRDVVKKDCEKDDITAGISFDCAK